MNELKLRKCKHKRRGFHQLFKSLIYLVSYSVKRNGQSVDFQEQGLHQS